MPPPEEEFLREAESHRRELLVHCYRMLGSYQDAEDVLQETYLRAWRGYSQFEGRASVRTWLYRIATRACLTALENKGRRVLPSGLAAPSEDPRVQLAAGDAEVPWLQPLPDASVGADTDDPATIAVRRETTRLAFIAALQQLPARQRAALILRDVLAWPAADVAELLELSVAAVNSALQRARAQLVRSTPSEELVEMTPDVDTEILNQYVEAFERADINTLSMLLRRDVQFEMPPIPTWFTGRDTVTEFLAGRVFRAGPWRLIRTRANGCPAAATYHVDAEDRMHAHSIQVLELRDGAIAHIYSFRDPALFAAFGLPMEWPDNG